MGIGIFEPGKWKASYRNGDKTIQTDMYKAWQKVIQFVSGNAYTKANPNYLTYSIDPEFIEFQKFGDWYDQQPKLPGWVFSTLGSRVLGPGTCGFVPKELSLFLCKMKTPFYIKSRAKNTLGIKMTINSVRVVFGDYGSYPEAVKVFNGLYQTELMRMIQKYPLHSETERYIVSLIESPPVFGIGEKE